MPPDAQGIPLPQAAAERVSLSAALAQGGGNFRGAYVHVPFCASTCDFCAFYQTQPTAETVAGFLEGVKAEAELVDWPRPVTTVFWGGGTPGLLAPRQIEVLAAGLRATPGWTQRPVERLADGAAAVSPARRLGIRVAVVPAR